MALAAGGVGAQDSMAGMAEKVAKPAGKPGNHGRERSMLDEKFRLINRIVQLAGADRVGDGVSAERQRWLLDSLYQMPLAQIRAMQPSGSVDGVVREMAKAKAVTPKLEGPAFGGNSTELVYVPLTPCRFVDSRNVGGPLVGTAAFDLDLAGNTYGGSAACAPAAAVGGNANLIGAIAINVAIVSPTAAPGFVGARPFGATITTALVNWYQAGASVQASNAGVVTTDQSASNPEIELFGSPTQYIVDIFGVFAAPTATALDCVYNSASGTTTIAAGAINGINSAGCPKGYAIVGGGCYSPGAEDSLRIVNSTFNYISPNRWWCKGQNVSGVSITLNADQICCRTPGRCAIYDRGRVSLGTPPFS